MAHHRSARCGVHQRRNRAAMQNARHRIAEPGLGVTIRDTGHITALEAIALAAAPPGRPHRRKERIPPGPAALRAAAILTGTPEPTTTVISLAAYEQAAKNRNTLR